MIKKLIDQEILQAITAGVLFWTPLLLIIKVVYL